MIRNDKELIVVGDRVLVKVDEGEELPEGGHYVCRLDMSVNYVRGRDWPAFLAEQAELHNQLKRQPEMKNEVEQ